MKSKERYSVAHWFPLQYNTSNQYVGALEISEQSEKVVILSGLNWCDMDPTALATMRLSSDNHNDINMHYICSTQ